MDDIQMLYDKKMIPWQELSFCYKDSTRTQKKYLTIASSEKIDIEGFMIPDSHQLLL